MPLFMLARSSHACVRACWIIARPFLLDTRAQWIPMHARLCLVDPHARTSVPARSPHAHACWIPTHARLCPLDPRTPVPAGSPHARACWIPAHPCLLDPRTPVSAGSLHARARWIPTHARVRAHRIPTPAYVRARWIPTHAHMHPPGPCMPAGCARTALNTLARTVPMPACSWGPHALTRCPHARARRIPGTHICICWMCHVCIPERYVVMGEGYCSSSSSCCCRTVL